MSAAASTVFRTYWAGTVTTNAAANTVESLLALIQAVDPSVTGAWREVLIQHDPDNVAGGGAAVGNVLIGDSRVLKTPQQCGYKLKIGDNKQYRDVTNTVPLANLRVTADTASMKLNIELVA